MRAMAKMERDAAAGESAGLFQQPVAGIGDDGTIEIGGLTLLNFGSCSYLGLNQRPELIEAAVSGIRTYGVSYSSSRTYSALALYETLESLLSEITDTHVIVTGSTTLAHLAALPSLVDQDDIIAIDAQAHASLHLAVSVLASRGVAVETIPHCDIEALESLVRQAPAKVWYIADTVYSMFGDIGPIDAIFELLDRQPTLHAYLDDAHGFGWAGKHGRGLALARHPIHPRMVVAASLSKCFGAGGGLLMFADEPTRLRVLRTGGTLTFTGPVQTAELAAGIAAAKLSLSDEHVLLQQRLNSVFGLVVNTAERLGIRLASKADTPVWFAEVGAYEEATAIALSLRAAGFYANLSGFPVVPHGRAGIRFTTTLAQSPE